MTKTENELLADDITRICDGAVMLANESDTGDRAWQAAYHAVMATKHVLRTEQPASPASEAGEIERLSEILRGKMKTVRSWGGVEYHPDEDCQRAADLLTELSRPSSESDARVSVPKELFETEVTLGNCPTPEPSIRKMVEHYYRSHGISDYQTLADTFIKYVSNFEQGS